MFTPSNSSGKIADGLLAALHLVGVDEVYKLGGVHAIGAMAYGTVIASLTGNVVPSIAIAVLLLFTVLYALRTMEPTATSQSVEG